jgi:hypothetical protein
MVTVAGWLKNCSGDYKTNKQTKQIYGDVTIAGEGLQNLGLCSALRAFEQRGIFIVPHLLRHGASVFPVSSEGPAHSVVSYDTRGDVEDLFLPGSLREAFTQGCFAPSVYQKAVM